MEKLEIEEQRDELTDHLEQQIALVDAAKKEITQLKTEIQVLKE